MPYHELIMAHARKIMVIRHGEKPPNNPPPDGVDADGTPDPASLTPRGWQRAGALVGLFDPSNGLPRNGLAVPNVLVASDPRSTGSKRPLETLTPLATHLHLDINDTFHPSAYDDAAKFAQRTAGVILICWQHEDIPAIGEAISGPGSVPSSWPGDRFDIVWIFDYDTNSATYAFSQVAEMLLPGDQNSTI